MARVSYLIGEWYFFASKNMVFIARLTMRPPLGVALVRGLVCGYEDILRGFYILSLVILSHSSIGPPSQQAIAFCIYAGQ